MDQNLKRMIKQDDVEKLAKAGIQQILQQRICYKYIDFNCGLKDIIKGQTLKFTNPADFNDPFDCHECLVNVELNNEIVEMEMNNLLKFYPKEALAGLKEKYLGNKNLYQDLFKEKKKKYAVSCFSKINNEILMWAHYANKHTGLCIGFQMDLNSKDYKLYPVNYISSIGLLDGLMKTSLVFYYWLTSKAKRWEYEQEIRAITVDKPSIQNFEKNLIKEVVFGCNTNEKQINLLISEMTTIGYRNVIFKRMVINPENFLLEEVLI